MAEAAQPGICHYFVDEAGDPAIFDGRGRVIIGQEGCSTHFMLGVLQVQDPAALDSALVALRAQLLADRFFSGVPSMQPRAKKTALLFHAKDDLPEVRREVFKILAAHKMRFFAVVRDKRSILAEVRQRNEQSSAYRYSPNELYDALVRRLFKDRLHKEEQYRVCFATRGKSDRTAALASALKSARDSFRRKWGIAADAPVEVTACAARASSGLQAADYFLWSLQRLYERGEARYLEYLWPAVGLVHDVDDRRKTTYGVYYTQKSPISVEKIRKEPGI